MYSILQASSRRRVRVSSFVRKSGKWVSTQTEVCPNSGELRAIDTWSPHWTKLPKRASSTSRPILSLHDATLAAIAERCPATLDDLQGISGMGAKKLEAYGGDVLRVCGTTA